MKLRPTIDADRFNSVAAECGRWSEKSLSMARDTLVDNLSVSEVAAKYDVSAQQVNVIRKRFLDKSQKLQLAAFMKNEKPKSITALIEPFSEQIATLRDGGYTPAQIVVFLKENGVKVTQKQLKEFVKGKWA